MSVWCQVDEPARTPGDPDILQIFGTHPSPVAVDTPNEHLYNGVVDTPFPGMDPYLEHPALWPDVHNSLVAALRDELTPLLAPRYYIGLERRTYLLKSDDIVFIGRPDLAVAPHGSPEKLSSLPLAEAGVIQVDVPIPDFPLPLLPGDDEPIVKLNAILHNLYDRARYDLRLDYNRPPVPPLGDEDADWANQLLADHSLTGNQR